MMRCRNAVLAIMLVASNVPKLAVADGTLSTGVDCGGDAFSSAEVIKRRPARRGPLTALPQTLCADLAPQRPATNLDIQVFPLIAPENGRDRFDAPYEWRRR